ncbi:MAG TPA: GNAT family N-acetyltransferase [Rubrobacteraceae bacterium]|nr:GNAT family N-acetyltransferase [Rubrobacteraceae bacterium]
MIQIIPTVRPSDEGRANRYSATVEIDDPGHPRDRSTLRDVSRVRIRAASPEDFEPLRRMFARLSPKSMYQRFHSPFPVVPEWALEHAVHVDHDARESLVAVLGGEIIGQVLYVRAEGKREAEVAVVVEDAWQRRGIGKRLLSELAARAERRGIEAFTGAVLHENSSMLGLAVAVRAGRRYSIEDGSYLIRAHFAPGRLSPKLTGAPHADQPTTGREASTPPGASRDSVCSRRMAREMTRRCISEVPS